jgi:4-hydroxybenzoate polyprenyltransferase
MLSRILWSVVVVLIVLWLIGLLAHIAGGFVHLLLIVALLVLLYNLFAGSRTRRASGR